MGAGQAAGGSAGPVQVKDSPLLLQQIEALQLSIRHLKNENNRLKVSAGGGGGTWGWKGSGAAAPKVWGRGRGAAAGSAGVVCCSTWCGLGAFSAGWSSARKQSSKEPRGLKKALLTLVGRGAIVQMGIHHCRAVMIAYSQRGASMAAAVPACCCYGGAPSPAGTEQHCTPPTLCGAALPPWVPPPSVCSCF